MTENLSFNNADQKLEGISALLQAQTSFERLPMLEIILDRFSRSFASELRSSTSDAISTDVHSISSMRFQDYINEVQSGSLTCIFKIKELESLALIILDRAFLDSMTNILMGGWRLNKPIKSQDRSFTVIERKVAAYLVEMIFVNLSSAFSLVYNLTFQIERFELNSKFATIVQPADAVALMQIKVDIDKTGGMMEIVLPYNSLESISDSLKKVFMGDNVKNLKEWNQYFEHEVENIKVDVEVVLGECSISFESLKNISAGHVLVLDGNIKTPVININGKKMFECTPGCVGSNVAVQILDIINED